MIGYRGDLGPWLVARERFPSHDNGSQRAARPAGKWEPLLQPRRVISGRMEINSYWKAATTPISIWIALIYDALSPTFDHRNPPMSMGRASNQFKSQSGSA